MKKRFFSIIMAVLVVMSAFSLPTIAYSRFCDDVNFNAFISNDLTSTGARYGVFSEYQSPYPTGGFYAFTASDTDRNGDGSSMKLKMIGASNAANNTNRFGVKYTPETTLTGKVYYETAIRFESDNNYANHTQSVISATIDGTERILVRFNDLAGGGFTLWDGAKGVIRNEANYPTWSRDLWYDIKICYDLDNNDISYHISQENNVLFDVTYKANEDESIKKGITAFNYYYMWDFKTLRSKHSNPGTFANEQITYLDNFKVETSEGTSSATGKSSVSTFDSYTPTSTLTSAPPSVPSGALWTYKAVEITGGGFGYEATDKGVSLKFTTGDNAAKAAQLRMNFNPFVTSVKSKFSIQVSDNNPKPVYAITGDGKYVQVALFYSDGKLKMFGKNVLTYKHNHWYDIEYSYNAVNGDYYYRVSDGENIYTQFGTYTQDDLTYPNTIQRIMFQINKSATASPMLLDNLMLDTIPSDFVIDKDMSVTDRVVTTDETVYARFTQKLNETAESLADKIFEYYGNAEIKAVSLLDEYTVKVDFEKETGKDYRIDFKNIESVSGDKVIDYIEITTNLPVYVKPLIKFKGGNGEYISSLTKGESVSVDLTLQTGTDIQKDAYAYMALYDEFNKLCAIDFVNTAFTPDGKDETLSLTVPQKDGAYKLTASVWKDDLSPYVTESISTPVVVIKLDDLRAYSANHFTQMTTLAEENDIKIGVGIIANTLEGASQNYIDAVKAIDNSPNAEIWCHGYTHSYTYSDGALSYSEFTDSLENQSATLKNSADILREKCGVTVRGLGTPGNYSNEDTIKAMEANPQYKVLLASASVGKRLEGKGYIHLSNWMNMESAVDVVKTLDALKANYESSSKLASYVLMAGHSYAWNETSKNTFNEFIAWLKTKDVTFMTPTEYYNFVS